MGVQELQGNFQYSGNWRHTYITSTGLSDQQQGHASLHIQHFYSDLLYQPWHCATTPLRPQWLEHDNLERHSRLSAADFRELFEAPNKPVVITDQIGDQVYLWAQYHHGQQTCAPAAHAQVILMTRHIEACAKVSITLAAILEQCVVLPG